MHLFLAFAICVWYAAYRHRRRWQAAAVLALGVPFVPVLIRLYVFIFTGRFLPQDGAIMDVISMTYAGTLLFIGVFLAAMPRHRALFPCAKCRYDLTGNVTGRCPECGTLMSHGQWIALEDHTHHATSRHPAERELNQSAA